MRDQGNSEKCWAGLLLAAGVSGEGVVPIVIESDEPRKEVVKLVGHPGLVCIGHFGGVRFWVGDQKLPGAPVNSQATMFMCRLVEVICDGSYAVSDLERERVSSLLLLSGHIPVVRSNCVLTGTGVNGEMASLDATFRDWLRHEFGELDVRWVGGAEGAD